MEKQIQELIDFIKADYAGWRMCTTGYSCYRIISSDSTGGEDGTCV